MKHAGASGVQRTDQLDTATKMDGRANKETHENGKIGQSEGNGGGKPPPRWTMGAYAVN